MKGKEFAVAKRGILVFTGRRSEVRCISGRLDVCLSSFKRRRRIPQHLPDRICEHLFPSHVYFGEEKHLPWFSSDVLGDIWFRSELLMHLFFFKKKCAAKPNGSKKMRVRQKGSRAWVWFTLEMKNLCLRKRPETNHHCIALSMDGSRTSTSDPTFPQGKWWLERNVIERGTKGEIYWTNCPVNWDGYLEEVTLGYSQ